MSDHELIDVSMQAFKSALRITKNQDDAEDIRQESLLRFVANPPKNHENIKGWFGMVGNNIALSRYRHQRVADRKDYTYVRDMGHGTPPEDLLIEGELAGVVRNAIDELSLRDRWIMRLRYFEGMGQDEIALILGIPLGTVMSATFRAMKVLRERLSPHFLKDAS
jgi:RNA polymerase sigma factor (sigma-70 family)